MICLKIQSIGTIHATKNFSSNFIDIPAHRSKLQKKNSKELKKKVTTKKELKILQTTQSKLEKKSNVPSIASITRNIHQSEIDRLFSLDNMPNYIKKHNLNIY